MKAKLTTVIIITLFLTSAVSAASVGPVAATSVSGLVGRWHFDEGTGTSVGDSSRVVPPNDGTLNLGTLGNTDPAAAWVDGKFGKALSFDGEDDYVVVPDSTSVDVDRATIEAWVYLAEPFPTGGRAILRKGHTSNRCYGLDVQPTRKIRGWVNLGPSGGSDAIIALGATTLPTNQWHHVAMTYNGTHVQVYVNGMQDAVSGETIGDIFDNSLSVRIGGQPLSDPPGYSITFKGKIDEIRVWNRALAAEEIKKHAWGLVGEWDFNEGSGTTAYDSCGFGNDGNIVGASYDSNGRFDDALHFDGDGDYVTIPDNPSLDLKEEITVESLIKVDEFVTYGTNPFHLYVVSKDQAGQRSYGIAVNINYAGYPINTPGFVVFTDVPRIVWASNPIDPGIWYHIAGTYKASTGELKIYVNGEDSSASVTTTSIFSGTANLRIGAREYTGWYNYFNGWIDEVRVWSKALVPVTFTQTGLDSSASGELVVTVSDPIPLDYDHLPHVVMVKAGAAINYDYEEIVYGGVNEAFKLVDVDPDEPSSTVLTTGLKVTGEYIELSPPEITSITMAPNPVAVNTEVTATASFTDPDTGETDTALWVWGDSSTSAGTVTEPNGEPGSVIDPHQYATAGVYRVTLRVTDEVGLCDTDFFEFVVVYDPSAGFVTGGGWIYSPPGAYAADETLEGKATFGFVSKYQKGASVPTGNTEFVFHVAGFKFKSTSYDWLVVAGSKAQFKGTGTVNGLGEYKFLLTAIDGGKTDVDQFRIKIWYTDETEDHVVYDNKMGAPEYGSDATTISGGSIVIHK